jgi:hypothetical protein
MAGILNIFIRTVFGDLRRRARESFGLTGTQCGAVTFVQRFNSALGLNVHFHAAVLDGVYAANADGNPAFQELPPPEDAEVRHIVTLIAERVQNRIARRGLDDEADPLQENDPGLAALYAAAVRGRIAAGPNAGNRLSTLGGDRIDGDLLDVLQCECCGGRMKILAAIHPPDTTAKILECLGLPSRAPPLAPAVSDFSYPMDSF